jgi:CheY-like chemotaxis protein
MADILVVDDDADGRKVMTAVLNKAGHKVVACASGVEALKELGVRPHDASVELPDLLVLDIMMPKADGYEVGTAIRNNLRTRAIPILMVSALSQMGRLFTATVQVEDFLTKPFDPETLIGSVKRILDKRKVQGLSQGRPSA